MIMAIVCGAIGAVLLLGLAAAGFVYLLAVAKGFSR